MAVDIERSDQIALVTLNRPEALNAFNSEQMTATLEAFRSLRGDKSVRCIILTGAGERAFAAGADIKEMIDKSPNEAIVFGRLGHAMMHAIEGLPQPVIAAVNGFALGGGCEIALACDIRLAAEQAVFAQPEVGLGIPPGWGGTQRLARAIGPGMAAEMIFSGRRVKADEALRIGLVNAVYPAEQLLPKAKELASLIAAQSPRAVALSKQLVQLAFNGATTSGLETEARLFADLFPSTDQQEGMRAFIDKRKPIFTGD